MTGMGQFSTRIRFHEFEANLLTGELFRNGQRIALPNQSFLALSALVERPSQLVTRQELRRRLWPDNRVVEFEQGLNAVINRLREALGDSAADPKFIETLPRRGYRFVAPVCEVTMDAPVAGEGPEGARTDRVSRYRLAAIAACAVIASVILTQILWSYPRRRELSNLSVEPLTTLVGREVVPGFAPDGEHLVFAWNGADDDGGRFDLYSKSIESERILRLTHHPAEALSAAWTHSGAQVAFARVAGTDAGIYMIPSTGGPERLLAPASFLDEPFMQLSWAPDDSLLAYGALEPDGTSFIHVLSLKSSNIRMLERPASCTDAGAPAFSPDGHQLAFLCISSEAVYGVYVGDLPEFASRLLTSMQGSPKGLAWSSDGRSLIIANDADDGSAIWRLTLSGQLSRMLVAEETLGPGVTAAGNRIAFVREKHPLDIWRVDLTTPADSASNLIFSTRTQLVPQYSPDGTRIAFESTRSGSSEIWLADTNGSNPVRLTSFNGPLTGAPSWCSDGRRIAFDSRASGASAIYVVDILEGRPHRLETPQTNLALPVWSADCRWIFASDGRTTLYRVPASGGPAVRFTDKRTYRASVSGDRVIFNVAGTSGVTLWSKATSAGAEAPLPEMPPLGYSDCWVATRRGVYFTQSETGTRSDAGASAVRFYDFASHRTRTVRSLQGVPAPLGGLGISVSPDEHWLAYTRTGKWEGDVMMVSSR